MATHSLVNSVSPQLAKVSEWARHLVLMLMLLVPRAAESHPVFGGPAASYGTGGVPRGIAAGDFNGDHKQDLVVANAGNWPALGNTVSVLLGIGDGTFQGRTDYGVGLNPHAVVVQDMNGDLIADLVVANQASGSVSILLGEGNGTFAGKQDFVAGSNPTSVATGDFNGDRKVDVVTANGNSNTSQVVSILMGNGDGTLQPRSDYVTGVHPWCVAVGDVSGDGVEDVIASNFSEASVSVFLGNGAGGFGSRRDFATDDYSHPIALALGDLDGDDDLDIATANYGPNTTSVLLGTGDGVFAQCANFAVGSVPASIAIGDVNQDGYDDLVVANVGSSSVSILVGNGAGAFTHGEEVSSGDEPTSIAIGDLNGDGRADLAVTASNSDAVWIHLNMGGAQPVSAPRSDVQQAAAWLSVGPSPLVDRLHVTFGVPAETMTSLRLVDVSGRLVATLVNGAVSAGAHEARLEPRGGESGQVRPGVYFLLLLAGEQRLVKRVVWLR